MKNIHKKSLLNIKILLVEDENFTRQELERFLKKRVGKVLTAKNGFEGLEILNNSEIDMVIADLKMPNMDGLEMLRKAREIGYNGPVIIISALSDTHTILEAIDMDIVKYIVKPIDTDELMEVIIKLSKEIVEDKELIIYENLLMDREKKINLETEIGRKTAYFLKTYTGKGPKNIQVFLQCNYVNIEAYEVLTVMDNNIVSNIRNYSIVDYYRKLFYTENKKILEREIGIIINNKVSLTEIICNSAKDLDILKFSIK